MANHMSPSHTPDTHPHTYPPPPVPAVTHGSPSPLSLSREPSTKRVRGQSVSSNASTAQPTPSPRPWPAVPTPETPDNHNRRPSVSHARQPSLSQSSSLSRSYSSTVVLNSTVNSSPVQTFSHPAEHSALGVDTAFPALSTTNLRDSQASVKSDITVTPQRIHHHQSDSSPSAASELSPSEDKPNASIGEFVHAHLVASFATQADAKLRTCSSLDPLQADQYIQSVCQPNFDPKFDQLLRALGHSAARDPTNFVDHILVWYNSAVAASKDASLRSFAQLNSSLSPTSHGLHSPTGHHLPTVESLASERRARLATCLLCRTLIEILRQKLSRPLSQTKIQELISIVYTDHFRAACRQGADRQERQTSKQVKWDLITQFIGVLFKIDFDAMAAMVLSDLQAFQRSIGVKGHAAKEVEDEAIMFMTGLRDQITLYCDSETAFPRCCRFLQSVSDHFGNVHGQAAKEAYCRFVHCVLLSLPHKSTNLFELPAWKKVLQSLTERANQLSNKPKYWAVAFPVQVALLCVSPQDMFLNKWQATILGLVGRFRERQTRSTALKAICRLLWVYFQRTPDSPETTTKTIDDLCKNIFFSSNKKILLSKEQNILEPLVYLLRLIGYHNYDLSFRTVIFPLMHYEALMSTKEFKAEQLDPDKMVLAIRAFLSILDDLEKNQQPPFPVKFEDELEAAPAIRVPTTSTRHRSSSRKHSITKTDPLAKPVASMSLTPQVRDYSLKFCDALSKITLLCDQAVGGQSMGGNVTTASTPKTPIAEAWSFNRRDDSSVYSDERLALVELLHVALKSLPRCIVRASLNPLLSVLCTNTARLEEELAKSAGQALKSIAWQGYAQNVIDRYSIFLANYDNKRIGYTEGMQSTVESMRPRLTLYVKLLHIWNHELQQKNRKVNNDSGLNKNEGLDVPSSSEQVDRVESQGLLFLASASHNVRNSAIQILRLVRELDTALAQTNTRIINVLESESAKIMTTADKSLSVAQRSLLERELRRHDGSSPLIRLCSSDIEEDIKIWYKVFPRFLEAVAFPCQMAVAQTRRDVCSRLAQMQGQIENLEERSQLQHFANATDSGMSRHVSRHERRQSATSSELTVEQWRVYLTFACKTLTRTATPAQQASNDTAHVRKNSKSSQNSADSFNNATDLFGKVIPFLSAHHSSIRHAAVAGLGAISITLFRPLLEALEQADRAYEEDKKMPTSHQRSASSPRRAPSNHFMAEIAHVYKLSSHFFQDESVLNDEWILSHLSNYTKELNMFLWQVDNNREFHKLRLHFCGLIEGFFLGVNKTSEPQRWVPFQVRRSMFSHMEAWSGFASSQDVHSGQYDAHAGYASKAKDRAELQNAALSAMAVLCAGPLQIRTGSTEHHFDSQRIMQWIHSLFNAAGDQKHAIGRLALSNVIAHNLSYSYPLERSIERFYEAETAQCLHNYVQVVSDAIMGGVAPEVPFWRIVTALLFTLSHADSKIRNRSTRLLRYLDEANLNSCKLQVLDISISDCTPAVYRKAQFEIATRLATQYHRHAFHVFSEFCRYFNQLHPDNQRNFVHAMLPWLQTVELQIDVRGGPSPSSYMLLTNLLEISLSYSAPLQHEVQALWQALATGPHGGNVKLILDVIMDLCLDRRITKLIEVARQIIVFLSETPAGQKLIDALLLGLIPRNMTQPTENRLRSPSQPETDVYPYLGAISSFANQTDNQHWTMSYGQLCLILLVDLIVAPRKIPADNVPTLLQAVLILWDHHEPLVQEQAREMLVHLIHELVISELDKNGPVPEEIDKFVDLLRERDARVTWNYQDNDGPTSTYEWSGPFKYVVTELIRVFDTTYSDIATAWGSTALLWGTQCPVRHLACRSLQIYRCLMTPLDRSTVASLISRLSVTIADEDSAVRLYALELMRAIRAVLYEVSPANTKIFPQLFWTICSCLDTAIESEYLEALEMLGEFFRKFDLGNATVYSLIMEMKPPSLRWDRRGLMYSVAKGCTSSKCYDKCLETLNQLIPLSSNELVGNDASIVYALLANLPRFAVSLRLPALDVRDVEVAMVLAETCRLRGRTDLGMVLESFAASEFQEQQFTPKIVQAIKRNYFPAQEAEVLKFQMGLLLNATHRIRSEALIMLDAMVAEADISKLDIPVTGSDFVTPLLKLLDTDLYGMAWPILDRLASVHGRPASRHMVEMSMVSAQSNRNMRKRYEDTPSFFGIPEESGWSVSMPAHSVEKTKANLNSVLSGFLKDTSVGSSALPTPDVEFARDASETYFHRQPRAMLSDEAVLSEANIGELVSELDDLDDFFEDNDASPESIYRHFGSDGARSTPTNGYSRHRMQDSFGSVGSESNQHVRSFQGSYSSSRAPPTPREATVMSPSAFAASPQRAKRPGMHPRSATSPAVNQHVLPEQVISIPTPEESGTLSEDEISGGGGISDGSYANDHARPPQRRTPSFRSMKMGLKKLVHKDDSPEVPKVPDEYLRNPKSSEL